ncbi:MAG TPA: cytidine deaminase [Sporichthya sp.]|jgi:cytidine deaminase|nr:cytidine deaminase [Sporichthya sp.]
MSVDWGALRAAAFAAAASAYAPYSGLAVGAAGATVDGRIVVGCNVENASYGLALCAECGMVSALVAGGRSPLVAVAVRSGADGVLTPCGRCRQVLLEHAASDCLVDTTAGPRPLAELLPDAFGPADVRS